MLDSLRAAGFQVEFHSHAEAILSVDFAEVADQLETILAAATIPSLWGWRSRQSGQALPLTESKLHRKLSLLQTMRAQNCIYILMTAGSTVIRAGPNQPDS